MSPYNRLLTRYLRPCAFRVGLLGLCLLGSTGLQLFIPQLIRSFIDLAVAGGAMNKLMHLALLYLGLSILNQLFSASSAYLSAEIGWSATNQLRADLFRHTLDLDMAYHQGRLPGEMIERIDGDVGSISNFFSQFIVRVSAAVLLTISVLVMLWRENWVIGLSLTIFTTIGMGVLHWRRSIAVGPTQQERELTAQLFGFIEERLTGLDDIRANGAGAYVMHRFLKLQRDWFARSVRATWLRGTIWLSTGGLFASGHVLILSLGVWLYLSGVITLGTVYLFINYMLMLEMPMEQITQQLQEFQKAAAGIRRVGELLDTPRTVLSGNRLLARHAHSIRFDQVRFRYAERDVLKDLSFRLEPGETLGLLGRTGSGKSTLIRLASRLYDATEGRILIDSIDLRHTNLHDLRRRIALVTQDVQLFHGTIRDNLTFFNSGVCDERIWQVLQKLRLRPWIEELPQQLDTMLEAGGSGLSAGQAQLLAFGRAFLRDPGIVILDEPSSRLDPATERLVRDAVDRLFENRTGIIIAHRLRTVERVDKIMVLAEGRILEYGPREALARNPDSRYSALLRLSSESMSLDEQMEQIA
ncbi:MAG TPA: ABC transporter ATP-binding protein [Blastocatellia bacterium]|nr:ABC transporter ATP-binding protein [Blastocatellia bacterium]